MSAQLETLKSMLSSAQSTLAHDTTRLEEYEQDHVSHSYAEDTAALIRRTEQKLLAGQARITALEYAVAVIGAVEAATE